MAIKNHITPGQTFGRLVVIEEFQESLSNGHRRRRILAQCECGMIRAYEPCNLTTGNTRSCGCLQRELASSKIREVSITHGMTNTPEYDSWRSAVQRCHNEGDQGFKNYGARGISVCDRWIDSFENFFADMGTRPDGTTLDRIDVNGPYSPSNCRWATNLEQQNNRRNNRYIDHQGRTQSLADWAREYGLPRVTLARRLTILGWPIQKALETSVAARKSKENVFIEYNGKRLTVAQWSQETGIKPVTIYARHYKGWPPERILSR